MRSCELEAIKIQDKVFMGETYKNPRYAKRLENAFIVAINCVQASSNCFCTSMGGGAKTKSGFDIALTEVIDEDTHYFIAEAGTEKGKNILSELPSETAHDTEIKKAEEHIASAEAQISRKIDTNGIKELLYNNYEHPEWDKIADACLSCGNCTMACPTCFCTTVEDVTDLTGEHTERWQSWDSCFSADFSYIHGGNTRPSTKSHYRQWVTHKLATWIDQFGSSGCVGCGNCITWCPVGIDITDSVKKIRGDGIT